MRRILFVSLLIVLGALFVYSVPTAFAGHDSTPEGIKKRLPSDLKELSSSFEKKNDSLVQMIKKMSGPIVGIGIRFGDQADDDTARKGDKYIPMVKSVMKGGPAEKSGVGPGDVILSVNGKPFTSPEEFIKTVRGDNNPGQKVTLELLYRREQKVTVIVTTGVLSNDTNIGEGLQKAVEQEGKALIAKVKAATETVTKALEDGTFDVTSAYSQNPKDPRMDPRMKVLRQAINEYDNWYDKKTYEAERLLNN